MPEQPRIAEELKKMEAEPLLPVELSLIKWSLFGGLGLLVVLVVVSRLFL